MLKKKCEAPDCNKEFTVKMPHAKYCSDKCRWRIHAREKSQKRREKGLCPYCGNTMEKETSASYCINCQQYYKKRYYKNKEKAH